MTNPKPDSFYDRLLKSYEFEATGNLHFDYFLALAEESKSRLRSSELILWLDINDYQEAQRCYAECLALFRDTGDRDEIPSPLHNLGYVALMY